MRPRVVQSATCPVRELSSPREVQSASWQSASWRIRELSSYRSDYTNVLDFSLCSRTTVTAFNCQSSIDECELRLRNNKQLNNKFVYDAFSDLYSRPFKRLKSKGKYFLFFKFYGNTCNFVLKSRISFKTVNTLHKTINKHVHWHVNVSPYE